MVVRGALIALNIAVAAAVPGCTASNSGAVAPFPAQITDVDFWQLSTEWSEPDGHYRSEGLTSNEALFQHVIPSLRRRIRVGDVYLGVGPEQNFTYIAALQPAMAIIVDIRRDNLHLHLMYKALFELAANRAEFVSKLFARPGPPGLQSTSSVIEIFERFDRSPPSEVLYKRTLESMVAHLTKTRALPLSDADVDGITSVYEAFYRNGFALRFSPTYADLMTQTDTDGVFQSFLASEDRFETVKTLQSSNRIIPVVGDFAGPKAIRVIGRRIAARQVEHLYPRHSRWSRVPGRLRRTSRLSARQDVRRGKQLRAVTSFICGKCETGLGQADVAPVGQSRTSEI